MGLKVFERKVNIIAPNRHLSTIINNNGKREEALL